SRRVTLRADRSAAFLLQNPALAPLGRVSSALLLSFFVRFFVFVLRVLRVLRVLTACLAVATQVCRSRRRAAGSVQRDSHRRPNQNVSLTASCVVRGPPPPRNGLPRPTSGVAVIGRNPTPRPVAGSMPLLRKSTPKLGSSGFEKLARLKM